jgi:putative DNA methylase
MDFLMTIEQNFDLRFMTDLTLREKQIQQNYRPIIAIHKWFARRPGTLYRGLLLSEFAPGDLSENFYRAHSFPRLAVADPFMGGGTPLIEANRLGCAVHGFDINPMAWWIVKEEIERVDLKPYREAADAFLTQFHDEIGALYQTTCLECRSKNASAKYFLWVKRLECEACGVEFDLFPGYLISQDKRHPLNVLVCPQCGDLNEVADRKLPGDCRACGGELRESGPASRGSCPCPACGVANKFPRPGAPPLKHRLFALEYDCPACKPTHRRRFFKKPDASDLARAEEASRRLADLQPRFIPDDAIPRGDETKRLHQWGMRQYRDLFNDRQLLGLELSARRVAGIQDARLRRALATNLSDLLRYQNMLCRYDTMALKSLDIFSIHGFPIGLIACESNLLGIAPEDGGALVGSGGWRNIIEKYAKAKAYCDQPFEVIARDGKKQKIVIKGEWIGERGPDASSSDKRAVSLKCQSSTEADLPEASLDAVFTDPPYFGNVQYAELMDFCYVWLRRLAGANVPEFAPASTRNPDELTGNITLNRGLEHFAEGLSAVFRRMARALKPGRPLAFTFHHNKLDAYGPIAAAILDSGLICSASLPCPGEMSASIHISGTGSSIVDTVFVCRSTGSTRQKWLADNAFSLGRLIAEELAEMTAGGMKPSRGDLRCIVYGHLTRLTVGRLRSFWKAEESPKEKLERIAGALRDLPSLAIIEKEIEAASVQRSPLGQTRA